MRVVIGVFVFRVLNSMKCDRLLSGLIMVTTIMFSLFFCSCHHSKNNLPNNADPIDSSLQGELSALLADTKLPPVDIPINIRVEKDILEDDMLWYVSKKDGFKEITFKIKKEKEDTMLIDATSWYYDRYVSGRRFKVEQDLIHSCEKYRGLLNLEMDVVNNPNFRKFPLQPPAGASRPRRCALG